MIDMYEKLTEYLHQNSNWNITKAALTFLEEIVGNYYISINISKINITDEGDSDWNYVVLLLRFYTILNDEPNVYDFTNKNIGSILIKTLYLENWIPCNGIFDSTPMMDQMKELFTIPSYNASLPDLAYLYSITDIRNLLTTSDIAKYMWRWYGTLSSRAMERFEKCFFEANQPKSSLG